MRLYLAIVQTSVRLFRCEENVLAISLKLVSVIFETSFKPVPVYDFGSFNIFAINSSKCYSHSDTVILGVINNIPFATHLFDGIDHFLNVALFDFYECRDFNITSALMDVDVLGGKG